MKMAEALAPHFRSFALVTQANWRWYLGSGLDYNRWYGIRRPFSILRLPSRAAVDGQFFTDTVFEAYDRRASVLARLLRSDLVYTRSARIAEHCVKQGTPVLLETHMAGSDWGMAHLRGIAADPRLLGVVTISPLLRAQYVAQGIPEAKVHVAYDAVDLDRFDRNWDRHALRAELGLPDRGPIVGYCGHLYAGRGIEDVVAAAELLPGVDFALVGGWQEDIDRWQAATASLANVYFVGHMPNALVPRYLGAADILVMPYSRSCSTAEWMSPMKLFEYMAARRPILASDLPAIRQVLRDGQNALLVEPDDGPAIAAGIRRLLSDSALAEHLADRAYQDVQPMTWERRAADILAAFLPASG